MNCLRWLSNKQAFVFIFSVVFDSYSVEDYGVWFTSCYNNIMSYLCVYVVIMIVIDFWL